jgi:hypothetical protein
VYSNFIVHEASRMKQINLLNKNMGQSFSHGKEIRKYYFRLYRGYLNNYFNIDRYTNNINFATKDEGWVFLNLSISGKNIS